MSALRRADRKNMKEKEIRCPTEATALNRAVAVALLTGKTGAR